MTETNYVLSRKRKNVANFSQLQLLRKLKHDEEGKTVPEFSFSLFLVSSADDIVTSLTIARQRLANFKLNCYTDWIFYVCTWVNYVWISYHRKSVINAWWNGICIVFSERNSSQFNSVWRFSYLNLKWESSWLVLENSNHMQHMQICGIYL